MSLTKNLTVFMIFVLSSILFAQAADTIVISKIVEQQIANARLKEKQTKSYSNFETETEKPAKTENAPKILLSKDDTDMEKVFIIGSAAVAAGAFVGFRRVRKSLKNKNSKKLKENIHRLRNEELLFEEDPKLRVVREKLNGYSYYDMNDEKLSQKAKEYKISQGEMMLAARLKSRSKSGER